ncbi:MAG: putative transposase [Psychromonas sp.]|jgi:putative transposase
MSYSLNLDKYDTRRIKQLQSKVLSQFKTGKSLFRKDGAFALLLKQFLDAALESEMEEHLDKSKRLRRNK